MPVRRNAPTNTGSKATTHVAAIANKTNESGESIPFRTVPSSINAHEITRLGAASRSAPRDRQTNPARANRNAARKYVIAAIRQGIERKKNARGMKPASGPFAVNAYASAAPPTAPQMRPLTVGMTTGARLRRMAPHPGGAVSQNGVEPDGGHTRTMAREPFSNFPRRTALVGVWLLPNRESGSDDLVGGAGVSGLCGGRPYRVRQQLLELCSLAGLGSLGILKERVRIHPWAWRRGRDSNSRWASDP